MTHLPPILDACCGARMMHADKDNPDVLFADIRRESHTLCDGRTLTIDPDVQMDFRAMPFADESFYLVLFDPPHLVKAGPRSWLALKYGRQDKNLWQDDLRRGFAECFRVLKIHGVLVFKWSEKDIPLRKILPLAPQKPIIGHMGRIKYPFHWLLFMKGGRNGAAL
ncbi:class I SAM-dependent methyltransferase [Candidatus Tokpelaia sp.]|uniref:class I SAM-dependent methyltransferase n=1 Tax=Candidatus Tokpelaia sp. TaxID=2233777 RepID=UPI0012393D6A|nr:class I SAM-dependent methyltransferase [Candidatus Tokpelaia sp.]KAA6405772.1 SAM-dependent methyltransferase [Candidatus Tokpelaia sp.]